ncbi:hypothetical protein SEVIR_5G391600v4 [Setaria viridis]|uniref:Uncharacterized protein n=2 Tax=Setaria TaxID=4554 RepID=A0A368RDQ2_SETIT|nr:uncharacterized protein LOC117857498 [Setaria viridis]RCV28198.1 hypothetical protein SETIT_5G386500v2 [Setaria italica]TKW17792.1 hypothetical protein SEVIR_5G391600v2 [Setaria viridis]
MLSLPSPCNGAGSTGSSTSPERQRGGGGGAARRSSVISPPATMAKADLTEVARSRVMGKKQWTTSLFLLVIASPSAPGEVFTQVNVNLSGGKEHYWVSDHFFHDVVIVKISTTFEG